MYILAIETTGAAASVALINEAGIVTAETTTERLNHLQNLMRMTEKLLKNSKLSIDDITCIGVSEGPGSFTGIRIGVSTARALAQALDIPVISVPTLQTFVYNNKHYKGVTCPLFDARRGQVYSGAYQLDEQGIHVMETVKGDAYTIPELLAELEKTMIEQETEIMFFGDGIAAYEEQLLAWAEKVKKPGWRDSEWENSRMMDSGMKSSGLKIIFAPEDIRYQNASSTGRMALALFESNKATGYENITPVYMRKAEAQRKLDEGMLTAYK